MKRKVIKKHDLFLIILATCIALISNILLSLFKGSLFSVIQIIIVSLTTIIAVFLATFAICIILYLCGWKFLR
mgnify:CR=1 FL=1